MPSQVKKICKICGAEYYICLGRQNSKLGTYLHIVCSPACFEKYWELYEENKKSRDEGVRLD
jgi:hypothetical protein